ncbi:MAG: putative lipid-binding transport protein (Tim44 family) [Nonlabens sp.]
MKQKIDYKSIVLSGSLGGLVYAIIMSIFYQFTGDEGFSIVKFAVDFIMFGLLVAAIIWWSMRKGNKEKKD